MYVSYDEYASFFGYDRLPPEAYERCALEADRIIDKYTTGIDNYRKLKNAFPTDQDDARMVKFCVSRIMDVIWQIAEVNDASRASRKQVQTENGTHGNLISSVSSGNESISYANAASDGDSISRAAADVSVKAKLIDELTQGTLRGMTDANGVNLMYMGVYPHV